MKKTDKVTEEAIRQGRRALKYAEAQGAKKNPISSLIKFGTVIALLFALGSQFALNSLQAGPQPNFLRWIIHVVFITSLGIGAVGATLWFAHWLTTPPQEK